MVKEDGAVTRTKRWSKTCPLRKTRKPTSLYSTPDTFGFIALHTSSFTKDMRRRQYERRSSSSSSSRFLSSSSSFLLPPPHPILTDCCVKQLKMPRYLAWINVECVSMDVRRDGFFRRVVFSCWAITQSERVGSSTTHTYSKYAEFHPRQVTDRLWCMDWSYQNTKTTRPTKEIFL